MNKKTLRELYEQHEGKVSDKWSIYLTEYDRFFGSYRDDAIRLLEIGIQNGGSLEVWSDYFPLASKIVGCDINPDCAKLRYADSRISVVVGDANSDDVESRIANISPVFDLIIDDGSHVSGDIVRSFARYFPRLVDGGIFVAEDLHCSYWQSFQGGLFHPASSIAFFKRLADLVNHEHWGVPTLRKDVLASFAREYAFDMDEGVLAHIHSVEFVNSMCVVRKAAAAQNALGLRFISGTDEVVIGGLKEKLHQTSPVEMDEGGNPWTVRNQLPEDEFEAKTALCLQLEAQLSQESAKLALESTKFEAKTALCLQLEAQLSQESAKLALESTKFEAKTALCLQLEAQLSQESAKLALESTKFEAKTALCLQLEAQLAQESAKLAASRNALQDTNANAEKITAQLDNTARERDQLKEQNNAIEAFAGTHGLRMMDLPEAFKASQRLVFETQQQVQAIHASHSWRATAPLRWGGLQVRRVLRTIKIIPPAIARAGGPVAAGQKVAKLLRKSGLRGLRRSARAFEVGYLAPTITSGAIENDSAQVPQSRDAYLLSRLGVVPTYLDPFADEAPVATGMKIAIHVHLHYADMLDSMIGYLSHIPCPFDLFVSTSDEALVDGAVVAFRAGLTQVVAIQVEQVPNRGRDVAPMLLTFGERLRSYDVIGHFHTKNSPHCSSLAGWYDELMGALCGSRLRVAQILTLFASDAKFVYFNAGKMQLWDDTGWADNLTVARELLQRCTDYDINDFPIVDFPQGTMFWASGSALRPLLDLPLQLEDFPSEPMATDGTLAHVVERLPLILASDLPGRNYRLEGLDSQAASSQWYEDQFDFSGMIAHPSVKVLAYYLPQFHATPENDEWHGAGFTEWHKVRSAQPLFVDHYQQHVPHSDIGYYTLEDKAFFSHQLDMMHQAGVHGLIFYHYWFTGRRILERPARMLLDSPEIAMPYCFCWANENWTRRWDGNEKEILLGQSYSDEDARAFITDLIPHFRDPRYIKIDGRPVLFVYRPSAIDDPVAYVRIWAEECARHGVARPYVVATLTRGAVDAATYSMDAATERVLHDWTGGAVPELKGTVQAYRPVEGSVLDYGNVVAHYKRLVPDRSVPLFRSLVPTWDNTPRYGSQAFLLHRFDTRQFQDWLEFLIADAEQHLAEDRRFVIVNAWNEWAEGAHLEPDRYFGYGYLNAIGRALSARSFDDTSYLLSSLQQPVRLRLNVAPEVHEAFAAHPASRGRFVACLAAALARAPVRLIGEEPLAVAAAALAGIGIEAASHEADFTLEFRSACLFQDDAVTQLLAMALRHAGYGISANVINLPDCCTDPNAQNASVGYWQRSGMTVLPAGPARGFKTAHKVSCLHLDPEPEPTATTPERGASPVLPVRVGTVVRYHARGDRRLLFNALLSLLTQEDCEVQLVLMVQDMAAEALESLSAQVHALPWAEACPPIIRSHHGTSKQPDLRALLLHEGLLAVGIGYAALLDYDDVLYPWAYRHLAGRLASTGKNATFGRVYTAEVDVASGMIKQRRRVYDYGGTFDAFFLHNHAPIHSFMLNLDLIDLSALQWFDDMRYMEDYIFTLQVFHPQQTDWTSLETAVFIGDYNHRIGDQDHTLAVDDAARSRLFADTYYQLCETRINDVRAARRHLLGIPNSEGG